MSFGVPMKPLSLVVVCGSFMLTACTLLPSSGPKGSESLPAINKASSTPHVVVNVTPEVIAVVRNAGPEEGFGQLRGAKGSGMTRIGIGDILGVTIFEASPGGLFVPAESTNSNGNFVNLPDQQVDTSGNISVPYAGTIHVDGSDPAAIQRVIEQRLANRAIEPQAVVAIKSQTSSQVSVLGDINQPSKFQINPKGERVLDSIARAGGPRQPGYETYVTMERGGKKATVYFPALIRDPSNNIYVRGGDTIYVYREPHAFMAFGASGENGRFDFPDENIMLTDALGRASGLLDDRANPGAVLVYRLESRDVARRLGAKVEDWGTSEIPVIYQFDLHDPGGFFLASNFPVHNKDVLYIGNAAVVQYLKLIDAVGATTSAASAGRNVTRD
jgi:polysaccharide export outer membrane protein